MADIVVTFKLNDNSFGDTTVVVTNPFKLKEKIKNTTVLKTRGSKPRDEDEWYELPNSQVYLFIRSLIRKMPFVKYDKMALQKVLLYDDTFREFEFSLMTPATRLYDVFLKQYKEYRKDKAAESLVFEAKMTQLLRGFLDGNNQVTNHGTIGWFHVYSVVPVDQGVKKFMAKEIAHRKGIPPQEAYQMIVDRLTSPISIKDYDSNDPLWVGDPAVYKAAQSKVKKGIMKAVGALEKLGLKRERETLILTDLSGKKNAITGGGVGGYAAQKGHGVVIDVFTFLESTASAAAIVAHEWAHRQWTRLSKDAKNAIQAWFGKEVKGAAATAGRVPDDIQEMTLDLVWDAFYRKIWHMFDKKLEDMVADEKLSYGAWFEKHLNSYYLATDAVLDAMFKYLSTTSGYPYKYQSDIFNKHEDLLADMLRATDIKDVEKRMRSFFKKHTNWNPVPQLGLPSSKEVRSKLSKAGVTPSAYAASNPQELWSELVAYYALDSSRVTGSLKKLFKKVIESSTIDQLMAGDDIRDMFLE